MDTEAALACKVQEVQMVPLVALVLLDQVEDQVRLDQLEGQEQLVLQVQEGTEGHKVVLAHLDLQDNVAMQEPQDRLELLEFKEKGE
jgi:hypothetical protein